MAEAMETAGTAPQSGPAEMNGVPGPETAMLLAAVGASGLPALHSLEPAQAREAFHARVCKTNLPPENIERIDDMTVACRDGGKLAVRVYRPDLSATRPLLLFFHGGGFVIGGIETHDPICRYLAARSGWTVVSVDYRLAPEHRYPTAVHDALDVFEWIWDNVEPLSGVRDQIALAGDSAGGTLAAVLAQHAHRKGRRLLRQILVYPALDHGGDYASRTLFGDRFLLTQESIRWFARQYYGHDRPELHPDASPARAPELAGLCPATIITAELDPLRDEAAHYARRLETAGVKTEYRCIPGVIHGFLGMARYVSPARAALDRIVTVLCAEVGNRARGAAPSPRDFPESDNSQRND